MATNRDITFTLKVVNDAKAGLSAFGIDLSKLATNANALGEKTGVAQKRAAAGVREHSAALRQVVTDSTKAGQAVVALAAAYTQLNRQQQQANARTRIDRARAREVELAQVNKQIEAEIRLKRVRTEAAAVGRTVRANARGAEARSEATAAEAAMRVTTQAALAQERVTRAVNQTTVARAREAAQLAETQARLAMLRRAEEQRAGIRVSRDQLALDSAKASAATQQKVAESNAIRTIRMNELAIQRAQLDIEQRKLVVQREQLRNEALIAAAKGRDLQLAERLMQAEQRTAAMRANAARAQASASAAQARANAQSHRFMPGGGHGRGGLLGFLTGGAARASGGNWGIGGSGSAIWPGLTGTAGSVMALGGLGAAARFGGSALAVSEYISIADTMRTLQARVGLVTDGLLQQGMAFRELQRVSQDTRAGLSEVTNVYYGLARSNNALGLSQREMLDITKGISQSIAISGVNAQAASFGLMQLAQAFGSGQLRGDELNSVLEQLPALAQAIAKNVQLATGEIGVGTVGALKTLAEQGKLSVKQVVDAIRKSLKDFETQFQRLPVTVSQGWEVMKTGVSVFIAEFDKATGATKSLGNLLAGLGRQISSPEFVEFAASVGRSVAEVAGMIGSVLLPALRLAGEAIKLLASNFAALLGAFLAFRGVTALVGGLTAVVGGVQRMHKAFKAVSGIAGIFFGLRAAVLSVLPALATLAAHPVILALAGLAAVIGFVGVKMYQSKKQAEEYGDALATFAEKRRQLEEYTPEQIKNLDASVLAADQQRAKEMIPLEAARYAELSQQAAKAKAEVDRAWDVIQQIYNRNGGQVPERGAQRQYFNEANRQFASAQQRLTGLNRQLTSTKQNLEDMGRVALYTGRIMEGALTVQSNVPIRTDMASDLQNRVRGWIGDTFPQSGKLIEQRELEQVLGRFGETGFTQPALQIGSKNSEEYARLLLGLPADAVVDWQTQAGQIQKLAKERLLDIKDNALAKALREARVELGLLNKEFEAGGDRPVERRLLELRKAIAGEYGKRVSPDAAFVRQQAESARPAFEQNERLKVEIDIVQSAEERLAVATRELELIGLTGVELATRLIQDEQLRKALKKNADLTGEQALLIVSSTEARVREAAAATLLTKQLTSVNDLQRKSGLETERAMAALQDVLAGGSGKNRLLDEQISMADDLRMSLGDFLTKEWPKIVTEMQAKLGLSEEQLKQLLNAEPIANAMLDVATNVRDAARGFDETYRLAALTGDELERQKFVLEQVQALVDEGVDVGTARIRVAEMMPAFDEGQARARMVREDPVVGTLTGIKRGYGQFLTEAKDLAEQFANFTKGALESVGDSFAELAVMGKANFREMTASILRDVARMIIKFLVMRAIMAAVGWVTGGSSGAALAARGIGPMEANGGVWDAGKRLQKYARGGLVTKPTLFPMANGGLGLMGEAGAEAIMPLRRLSNGRLGVESTKGGGGGTMVFAPSMSVTVDGSKGGSPEQNEDLSRRLADQMGKMMDAKIAEFSQRQMRPGGMFRSGEVF